MEMQFNGENSFLPWSVAHDSIMTNTQRKKRSFTDSNVCSKYKNQAQTSLHSLRDYCKVGNWNFIFATALWSIWKQRNDDVFNNKESLAMALIPSIMQNVLNYHEAVPLRSFVNKAKQGQYELWGLVRDSNGRWCLGFAKKMGKGDILAAKVWAILTGLQHAWHNNHRNIILEDWNARLIHTARDGNKAADAITKADQSKPFGHHCFENALPLCNLLDLPESPQLHGVVNHSSSPEERIPSADMFSSATSSSLHCRRLLSPVTLQRRYR
ncbi:ribonuclease H [Senna tora]|uniref:Ribonuclease H n=1 Tax=Senna tora TaxID=362788 RepID=A0A834T1T8_9FABA|nr:ribonuclease H [Senna tora]